MLKRLVNEVRLQIRLTTVGPVLVRAGHASVSGPDMTPVRTHRNGEWQVYLPGSSLKGVIRSHAEKICRTLHPSGVCNPFVKASEAARSQGGRLVCSSYAEVACGDRFEVRKKGQLRLGQERWKRPAEVDLEGDNERIYADSCPACRLFGSNSFIGRASFADAYLNGRESTETRDGVGIDRLTGGAAHGAKFELEAVSSGVQFSTEILVRNFECWQLGMLLVVIADLREELVRVGSGRSRGLGAVRGEIAELTIHTLGPTPGRAPGEVWGLGRFLNDGTYGTLANDHLTITPAPAEVRCGIRQAARFSDASLGALEEAAQTAFVNYVSDRTESPRMRWQEDWQRAAAHG